MFSNQLNRVAYPLARRSRGIVLGTLILLAAAAALVSARTVSGTFWVLAAAFLVSAAFRRDIAWNRLHLGPVAASLGVFALYAALSATWADVPRLSLEKAGLLLLVGAATLTMAGLIKSETRPNLIHMGEGLFIGLLVGVVYLAVETFSDQVIKLWLYRALELHPGELKPANLFSWDGDRLVSISVEDLTRNMTDAALFLSPAIMAVAGIWRRPQGRIAAILLFVLTVIVVIASRHAASKLAVVVGLSVFALAYVSRRWATRVVRGAWIVACLAVVPLALLASRLDMEDADWLSASARHRIVIWNYTAEMTLEHPVIGIGANMTYLIGPELERRSPPPTSNPLARTLSIHSHNVYLQTWFELGAIGALLLMAFGLSVIGAIGRLGSRVQPYAYATFVSAATMAAVSYGMWQAWFVASFGLTAVLCVLGAQCLTSDNSPAPVGAGYLRRDQSAG